MVFANIRAQVVFPNSAGSAEQVGMSQLLIGDGVLQGSGQCNAGPTTVSNVAGRYLRADTI